VERGTVQFLPLTSILPARINDQKGEVLVIGQEYEFSLRATTDFSVGSTGKDEHGLFNVFKSRWDMPFRAY
jgi:hypothetical protein